MFRPRRRIKNGREKRWLQRDRAFFRFGACHILAGVFLEHLPLEGFYGECISPSEGFSGTHLYVANGELAVDFPGHSFRKNLLSKYWHGYQRLYPGCLAKVARIDFPLLETLELNERKHLGPDQYFDDPRPRAK